MDNVGEGMFYLVVALIESVSVPLRTQLIFLLLSVGTNIIIMPSKIFIQGASGNKFLIYLGI